MQPLHKQHILHGPSPWAIHSKLPTDACCASDIPTKQEGELWSPYIHLVALEGIIAHFGDSVKAILNTGMSCALWSHPQGISHILSIKNDFFFLVIQSRKKTLVDSNEIPLGHYMLLWKWKGIKNLNETTLFYPWDIDVINIANCGRDFFFSVRRATSIVLGACLV